ncbi:hypothetical protein [Peribacillus kribbensis]|uniref:hypothetical protein n=1 Tax=Peribacillus kribbensis TaxID=356658 RepID=UPI00040FEADE|nr:hypothetical protein [Peribacillus kribbensis]
MEKKMSIDPEKFAYTVISSHQLDSGHPQEMAKKQLTLYLTADLLAEEFNELESQSFKNMEKRIMKISWREFPDSGRFLK